MCKGAFTVPLISSPDIAPLETLKLYTCIQLCVKIMEAFVRG